MRCDENRRSSIGETSPLPHVSSRFDSFVSWILVGALMFSTALIIRNILDIAFWRDDDLIYAKPTLMEMRVRGEGRWLNYLLYPFIRNLNGFFAWGFSFVCTFFFFAKVARLYVVGRLLIFALALMCLQYPGFYAQSLWPVFCVPGAFVLAIAATCAKRIPIALFFLLFGCLLIGSNTQLYFFLPLLFLDQNFLSLHAPWKKTAEIIAIWIFGLIAGYGFASFMNLFLVGEWGIHLASWRESNLIVDFVSAKANAATRWDHLGDHLSAIFPDDQWILLLPAALWFLWTQARDGRLRWLSAASTVLIFLASAIYAVTLYNGIWINYRTTNALFLGVIFLFLLPSMQQRGQALYCLAIFTLVVAPMSWQSYDETRWFSRVSGIMADDLKESELPKTARIIVDAKDLDAYYRGVEARSALAPPLFMERLDKWFRWRGCASSLGFTEVIWCRTESGEWPRSKAELCEERLATFEAGTHPIDPYKRIAVLQSSTEEAVIRMLPPPNETLEE